MNIFARITHSLSARLLVIFVIASFAYSYGARHALQVFTDTDWLRQIVGAHIALYTEYVLEDIGSPPNIDRAMEIVSQIPVDIRIVGPGEDWSSDPDFPDLDALPFGPLGLLELSEASRNEVEAWTRTLELVEFARHEEHVFVKLTHGDAFIVFASPRIREIRAADLCNADFQRRRTDDAVAAVPGRAVALSSNQVDAGGYRPDRPWRAGLPYPCQAP